MKASELRLKSAAELRGELLKLRKEQFALRLQRATGQAVKPDQFGKVRRSIARLKTAMRAGQIAAASNGASGTNSAMGAVTAAARASASAATAASGAAVAVKKAGKSAAPAASTRAGKTAIRATATAAKPGKTGVKR